MGQGPVSKQWKARRPSHCSVTQIPCNPTPPAQPGSTAILHLFLPHQLPHYTSQAPISISISKCLAQAHILFLPYTCELHLRHSLKGSSATGHRNLTQSSTHWGLFSYLRLASPPNSTPNTLCRSHPLPCHHHTCRKTYWPPGESSTSLPGCQNLIYLRHHSSIPTQSRSCVFGQRANISPVATHQCRVLQSSIILILTLPHIACGNTTKDHNARARSKHTRSLGL